MICVIRIAGQVNLKREIAETLYRLKLRQKLNCIFIEESDKIRMGMLKKVENFVAYGKISDELKEKVINKRGEKGSDKKYKGFCRLHPPIGGFKKGTKKAFPNGVLGKNKDIDKLLERML